jgi:tryptophan synthase
VSNVDPTAELTVDLMLAMEAGGADIIEVGSPFTGLSAGLASVSNIAFGTDPIGDGPAIQGANNASLSRKMPN